MALGSGSWYMKAIGVWASDSPPLTSPLTTESTLLVSIRVSGVISSPVFEASLARPPGVSSGFEAVVIPASPQPAITRGLAAITEARTIDSRDIAVLLHERPVGSGPRKHRREGRAGEVSRAARPSFAPGPLENWKEGGSDLAPESQ